jgi:hypothetical protein
MISPLGKSETDSSCAASQKEREERQNQRDTPPQGAEFGRLNKWRLRRIIFKRLGFHRPIIPDREQSEQEILDAAGLGSRDPGRSGARLTRFIANPSILQDGPAVHPIGRNSDSDGV